MNCQEALDLLYEIIDKEASEIDAKEVEEHLENCRDCFGKYQLERSLQDFINEKLKSDRPAARLEYLKSRILGNIDRIDGESTVKEIPRPFRRPATILVVAASLVILFGVVFWGSKLQHHQKYYIPLEKSHWAVSGNDNAPENVVVTRQTRATVTSDFGYLLDSTVGEFALMGGLPETIMGVSMMHFLYVNDNSKVSVFLAHADQYTMPSDLEVTKIERHDRSFFDHNCRGCRLVFHRDGDTMIITATSDRSVELLDFIPGHSSI